MIWAHVGVWVAFIVLSFLLVMSELKGTDTVQMAALYLVVQIMWALSIVGVIFSCGFGLYYVVKIMGSGLCLV